MLEVVLGSLFRNATGYLPTFLTQLRELRQKFDGSVRLIAVEGDSTDGTYNALAREVIHYPEDVVIQFSHGGPVFGSTESPERLRALSRVGNALLAAIPPDTDVFLYVESDLLWDAGTMQALIQHARLRSLGFDIFAPMVFAGEAFYDIWGFRKNGVRFSPFYPYHFGLKRFSLTEVDSVGSCLAMRGDIARIIRMTDQALVSFCRNAQSAGFTIAVDPKLKIYHPC